jgi:hypothetical protein
LFATIASPTPVLPDVGSMIVPPAMSLPWRSADSIIRSAILSFTEPPGFRYSTLTRTFLVFAMPRVTDWSRTSGVPPVASASESYTCMIFALPVHDSTGPGGC